ncbi:MerR family transcriptional regulator [Microbacterium oleivorans]|uniref:Putative MerR-family transcriptional regulator n=1 Tax=Microbacterium oleivorans TaxID=273677 RepID=A0A031FNN2_9MICO|nr:MerR family transcriptional regulator [Microbacterium oleivorans]EZP25225.1 putative MerR-family transcriptional regulator [Microbacterium oleivorans]
MTAETNEWMTAGRFGASTLLSAKALRIYADRGLLAPRRVVAETGYRYYSADQVQTGWLIALLRSADLSLDHIAQIVDLSEEDPDAAVAMLDEATAAMDRRAQANHVVLARARLHLTKETHMSAVETVIEGDRPVLSVMRRMAPHQMDQIIHAGVHHLRQIAEGAGLQVTGDAFGVFHAPVTDDSDGPLEIVLPVDGLIDGTDDMRSYRMTGGQFALRHAEGRETDFPEILALYDEVHGWIMAAGGTPTGPPREIWHNSPGGDEPLRLTVAWPYAV